MKKYQRWYLYMNDFAQVRWETTDLSQIHRFVANAEPSLSLEELQEMLLERNRVSFASGEDLYHIVVIPRHPEPGEVPIERESMRDINDWNMEKWLLIRRWGQEPEP